MKFLALFAFLGAALLGAGESANVLGVFTSNSPSHLIIHMSYARALVERGHNVTVITTLPLKYKNPRFHHIHIPSSEARMKDMSDLKAEMTKPRSALTALHKTIEAVLTLGAFSYDATKDQVFQDFMNNPDNKFDLMILGYFMNDFQLGVGLHFKCPIIISWMASANLITDRFIGNPPEISYVPVSPMFALPDMNTFVGRLANFFMSAIMNLYKVVIQREMVKSYTDLFPGYPPIEEAGKTVSLVLCNSHFSEGFLRPNVPASVDVGGIQIKDKPDPLPKNLQDIFNASSEHGVIFISFGSNLGTSDLRPEFNEIIFKALASLKQTVLWKWDGEQKPGNAPNIHFEKWLPQDDLLAHPNLKLFITHAGKGSVAEAQYHGVPMVTIPMFADQPKNADQVVKDGFGLMLQHNTMTSQDLVDAVNEVLVNPKYRENVKQFSTLYTDRPMTARETAIYWIEYVIRHKGAYHMQSPLVHLNAWQYLSLDVIGFLLLVAFVVYKLIRVLIRLVRKLLGRCCSKKQKVKKQ